MSPRAYDELWTVRAKRIEVGVTRFERATSWSQTKRSSQTELHPAYVASYLKRGETATTFARRLVQTSRSRLLCGYADFRVVETAVNDGGSFQCRVEVRLQVAAADQLDYF